jgi:hypothetical protein
MSTQTMEVTVENILTLVEQLSEREQYRLRVLLEQKVPAQPSIKPPRDKRVPCEPMPDRTREWEWIESHKHEYAGQWVALEGDRLIAASPNRLDISDALKTAGAKRPLIHRIPSPDDLPYIGI